MRRRDGVIGRRESGRHLDSSLEGVREAPVQVESAYPIQVNLDRLGLQGAGEE